MHICLYFLVWLIRNTNAIEYSQIINATEPEQFVNLTTTDFEIEEEFENVNIKQVILDHMSRIGQQLNSNAIRFLDNPTGLSGKLEGDIELPPGTNADLSEISGWKLAYTAIADNHKLWPNAVIPFSVSNHYGRTANYNIRKAINHFERKKTCLKFVRHSNQTDYIVIRPVVGCSSHVGRTGGRQDVSLQAGCTDYLTVIHELMHAAGFYHEQARYDRDDHIMIHWNNIENKPGIIRQFDKQNESVIPVLGVPYDQNSIMHYKEHEFSISPVLRSISAKDGGTLSNKLGLTDIDVNKINTLYDCSVKKSVTPTTTTTTTYRPIDPLPAVIIDNRHYRLQTLPEFKSLMTSHFAHHHNAENATKVAVEIVESFDDKDWFVVSCNKNADVWYTGHINVIVEDRQHWFYPHYGAQKWHNATEETLKSHLRSIQWSEKRAWTVYSLIRKQFSGLWHCVISSTNDTILYGNDLVVRLSNGHKFITVFNWH